jgi:hypothetical protein
MADKYPEFGFKFNIGDDVIFSVARRASERWNAEHSEKEKKKMLTDTPCDPHPFSVVHRLLEECYGGVQRAYYLRAASVQDRWSPVAVVEGVKATVDGLFRASEIELEALESATKVDAVDPSAPPRES